MVPGVCPVRDPRVERLAALYNPKKVTPATIQYLLMPDLTKDSAKNQELFRALLNADVLAAVVRAFRDDTVFHLEGSVDPRRDIPEASIPIHGITPDMVAGAPTIADVLPAFHAFAQDTVLVAHNAAFDMRFLELKQQSTGVTFDQPVLDTLLLSAVVHPQQESHRLEAIAQRLGVNVLGRHTAVGDAMVTAEIFLKLVPLLAERGIHTLAQARDAAQQTYYARVRY